MVPTDRQLVDNLLATILSTSRLIELVLEDEIENLSRGQIINIAQLKALGKIKQDFMLRALIMEYALNLDR